MTLLRVHYYGYVNTVALLSLLEQTPSRPWSIAARRPRTARAVELEESSATKSAHTVHNAFELASNVLDIETSSR